MNGWSENILLHVLPFVVLFVNGNTMEHYYEGYKIIRFQPSSSEQMAILMNFTKSHESVDILMHGEENFRQPWILLMSKEDVELYMACDDSAIKSIPYQVIETNVNRAVEAEAIKNERMRQRATRTRRSLNEENVITSHDYYRRFDEMKSWLEAKCSQHTLCSMSIIGHTYEQRQLLLMKISTDSSKPIIWIDGGIHAREWIAPAASLYIIEKLLENSQAARDMLKQYQFYILPLMNPDGYEFTHSHARYWRKNRSPTVASYCIGVDLNRNFPFKWGGGGSSVNPCTPTYRGVQGASELETQAVITKMTELKDKIHLVITLHSFGQFIMTPYGHSMSTYARFYQETVDASEKAAVLLRQKYGRGYIIGSSADVMYAAAGGSGDFAAGTLNIPFTVTIELPDKGRYGFLLPASYISSVGNQVFDILQIYVKEL